MSDMVPAIPPTDYRGSTADWIIELKSRGHMDVDANIGEHVDLEIPADEWWDILETCEK